MSRGIMGEIRLTLKGERDRIDVRALSSALDHLTKLVTSLSDSPPRSIPVTALSLGSNVVAVAAPDEVDSRLDRGVRHLVEEHTLPRDWDVETTDALNELASLGGRNGVEDVELTVNERIILVNMELGELARDAVESVPESLGSVTGRMYYYSNPSPRRDAAIGIDQVGTGRKIRVSLPQQLSKDALQLLEQGAEVWGYLRRNPETDQVLSVRALGVEPASLETELPLPARAIRGIWADEPLDSVAVVRSMRDA